MGIVLYAAQLNTQDILVIPEAFSQKDRGTIMQRTYLKTNELTFAEQGEDGLEFTWRGVAWGMELAPEQKTQLDIANWFRTGDDLIPPASCIYFAVDVEVENSNPVKLGEIKDVNCFNVIQSQQVIPFNYDGTEPDNS